MRIGIDIDGVLTDVEKFQHEYGSVFFNKPLINDETFHPRDMFGVSHDEDHDFWKHNIEYYATEYPARYYASEATNKLHELGVEIYILTARYNSTLNNELGLEMRTMVKKWLKKNNIYFDKIIFTNENKSKRVDEFKIDYVIEDKPENINDISKHCPVIIMTCNYNRNFKFSNTIRCHNWWEILNVFENKLK